MTTRRPRQDLDVQQPLLELGPTLGFLSTVWRLNHSLERASKHMETQLGVTAQQRMIIRVLGRYPGVTPGQVARSLWVDAGTLSAALKRLERRGLVRRERDVSDRRRVLLYLTDAGVLHDVPTARSVEQAVEEALQTEGADAQAEARRFFETLAVKIGGVADGAPPAEAGGPAAGA